MNQRAFAAVVYMRSVYENGNFEIVLLASKTRVAKISQETLNTITVQSFDALCSFY